MKKTIIFLLTAFYAWYSGVGIVALESGVYNGSESELKEKIACLEIVRPKYGSDEIFLMGFGSCEVLSITKCSFIERPFFKYYFIRGQYIPRKYNHIIEDKLSSSPLNPTNL